MNAVRIRRPDLGEVRLSTEEVVVAIREGIMPAGPSDAIIMVADRVHSLVDQRPRRPTPALTASAVRRARRRTRAREVAEARP